MKLLLMLLTPFIPLSPSSRRAWIEITEYKSLTAVHASRPPHGGRGLKLPTKHPQSAKKSRPPHGGRGLKFLMVMAVLIFSWSPSSRRAWIEIFFIPRSNCRNKSPSSRRAWIEINQFGIAVNLVERRPPHGGRGLKFLIERLQSHEDKVALLTEGVD